MFLSRRTVLAAIVACAPYAAAAFDLGPLSDIVQPRADESWTITEENGAAIFANSGAPYAISYYYINPLPGQEGRREISVEVGMLASQSDSRAGLLYGLENDPRSYFMYTVGGDRSVNLQFFKGGELDELLKLGMSSLRADKTILTIREKGDEIELLVNGEMKSAIGNDQIGHGAVGIVAGHVGRYSFRNFTLTD